MSAAPYTLPGRVVRFGEAVSLRIQLRGVVVGLILVAVVLALSVFAIGTGEFAIPPGTVVSTLLGGGDPGSAFIVRELRLPRVVCALLVGAALGVSGAVFQSLTRNPLGSPDIVGFPQGAAVGALIVITILSGSGAAITVGALAGGVLTAFSVYLLAFKRGGTSGFRIVLIGIAISYLLVSVIDYLLARARIEDAQEATRWLLGSLNGRTWEDVTPLAISLAVLVPLAIPAARALRALELGDDSAHALGLRVERSRLGLVALAVGLVSVTTVAVGPIGFIALTAPQIARRVARTAGLPLVSSALMGAALTLASDIAAQRLVPDRALPVGVMTGLFGGVYLAWLLTMEWRKGRG
ncbi:iron chelate uptake ABC transporter family permease subunit [Solirubrobacter phytolaccae]|uniref:Iron chelate uptake ABC transporter family permease subunit n=1 Tax=Solirubrobacter phytolaccae TaxID=1404360 RepID=A0A9X3NDV7_9ACTN|nr:iron chelate uptake ABC transporter family permease subunit [Solirubrobacter phytolaccae]MDA0183097.1 iron chelate uptake ABC transporter family permease subunit [Solirubrobacter phytolaccae]